MPCLWNISPRRGRGAVCNISVQTKEQTCMHHSDESEQQHNFLPVRLTCACPEQNISKESLPLARGSERNREEGQTSRRDDPAPFLASANCHKKVMGNAYLLM